MALSQIQCLDDNHVNPRTTESKPEFFYCEEQRLALETLLRDGREAFVKYLEARGLRGFLSDPELEGLVGSMEPYDPGLELIPESGEEDDDEPPLSLHYWPELSDVSIPQLDLGWPDSDGYRGVSRATVYTQPPLDGQAHIKEIIRKMIAQAQRVIAVVMDVFTDVDIFRDLLDAAFKKKVSVYILLERTTLPHFLSMCHRANMHAGHLKNLRVRCSIGAEFHTRSCTKVKGRMGHRFMFVDGDKAVSGSYSFTWMSSRLDRNLITVLTGQVVDTFDLLFRFLYMNSTSVNLRQIAKEPQPEPDPPLQPTTFAPPSADIARKLYNPKYALVAACNPSLSPDSSGNNSPKDSQNAVNSKTQEDQATNKKKRRKDKEVTQEAPLLHPGLTNLGKAHLIEYLPTWPEPDPPSDVIGFINVRDTSKPIQVHLQRSEMFETSQAIRFCSPISMPKETPPKVPKPRKIDASDEENLKQDKTKAEEAAVVQPNSTLLTLKASGFKSQEAPEQKSQINVKALNTECNLQPNTPTKNQSAGHNPASNIDKSISQQSGSKATPSHITPTVPIKSLKTEPLPKSDTETQAQTRTSLNTQHALEHSVHSLEPKSPQILSATDLNTNTEQFAQSKKVLQHTYSSKQDVHTKTHNSSINTLTPNIQNHISPSSAFTSLHCNPVTPITLADNNQVCATTVHSSMTSSARAPVLPLTSISTTPSFPTVSSSSPTHPLSSSTFTTAPPVPKRHTVQLVINDISNGQNPPDISVVRRPESLTSTQPVASHNEPLVATVIHALPKKEPETVPKLQNKTDTQKGTENTGKDCSPLRTSQEIQTEEAAGLRNDRVDTKRAPGSKLQVQYNVLITNAPKENCTNIQDTPVTSTQSNITKKIEDCVDPLAKVRPLRDKEAGKVLSEEYKGLAQSKTNPSRVNAPQRISHNELKVNDTTVLGAVDSVNATKDSPVSDTFRIHIDRADDGTSTADSQKQHSGVTTAYHINSLLDAAKHNTNNTFQDSLQLPKARGIPHSPEKPRQFGFSESYTPYLRSPTPEKDSRLLFALARTPTPDGFSPHSPNSDSRSHTPDFRTPTPDGYFSTFSTTSEEYFECSDSPLHDLFFDPVASFSNDTEDDLNTNTSYAPTITTVSSSPTFGNTTTSPGMLSGSGKNTSRSGNLSQHCGVSLVSLPEKKLKMMEEEKTINDEKWKEQDGKRSLAERSNQTQRDSQRTERRGSKENKSAEHLRQNKASTEVQLTVDKAKETQVSKRKKALNQQEAADNVVTPGESSNEAMQMSAGEVKAKNISEGWKPDKASLGGEKTLDRAGFRPSGMEKTLQTLRESDGQKQQKDTGLFSPLRLPQPPRPTRSLLTTQPIGPRQWGGRHLNHTESKAYDSSLPVFDNTPSPRRLPPRPPAPVAVSTSGSAAGRRHNEVSQSQQSPFYRQPPAVPARPRPGQSQNQTLHHKPQASFLHTHSHMQPQALSQPQKQTASVQEGQEDGRTLFSITFSGLYNIKGLKDKVSRLPTQNKRSSTGHSAQGRKTTG